HTRRFLTGPLLVDASNGSGGTRRLVVGPSKDGTVYAVDPVTGALVWSESLVTNGSFAGFGVVNAAPARAHGTPPWSAQIGRSWAAVTYANGLLFVGTRDVPEYYVYDAASGARLKTLT